MSCDGSCPGKFKHDALTHGRSVRSAEVIPATNKHAPSMFTRPICTSGLYHTACARALDRASTLPWPRRPRPSVSRCSSTLGGGRRCHNWSAREHTTGSTSSLLSFRHVRLTLISISMFILPLIGHSSLLTFRNATISWQRVITRRGSSI